jgi:hypothetical protein
MLKISLVERSGRNPRSAGQHRGNLTPDLIRVENGNRSDLLRKTIRRFNQRIKNAWFIVGVAGALRGISEHTGHCWRRVRGHCDINQGALCGR